MVPALYNVLLNRYLSQLVLQSNVLIGDLVGFLVLFIDLGNVETLIPGGVNEVLSDLLLEHGIEILEEYLLQSEIDVVLVVADQDDEYLGPVRVEVVVLEPLQNIFSHLLDLVQALLTDEA